jgi:O-antigen/teichoic acid export membrane protein
MIFDRSDRDRRDRGEFTLGVACLKSDAPDATLGTVSSSEMDFVGEGLSLTESSAAVQTRSRAFETTAGSSANSWRSMSSLGAVIQSITVKVLIIGINAFTGIITARVLRPEGRGELAAMILWPVFLAAALSLGVPSALTFQLRRNPARQSRLMGAALLLAILTGAAAALLGMLFMQAWIPQYSPRVILFAKIFLFSAPITSLLMVGRAGLESRGDFAASNKLLIWSPAMTLLWLGVLFANRSMTPFSASLAYVPVGIVPLAWMLVRLFRVFQPSLKSFWESARQLFSYGIRSYGIDLCGTMSFYVDQALVVRLLEPGLMGTYVVALSLSRMLNVFHTSVVMVLFPRAVSRSLREVAEMTSRAMRMTTVLTTLAGIGIVALGPEVLSLLYGREYRSAGLVLRILVVEVILSGATQVLSQAFMALGRPGIITGLQVTGLALTIPLMFVLVPRFGIVGAGTALLCSTIARLLFVVASFPVFLKMRVPNLLPKVEDLHFAADAIGKRLNQFRRATLVAVEGAD